LSCEEKWFTIYPGATCVCSGVEFTAGFYPDVHGGGICVG
jgi:hypothetical protein